MTDTTFDALAAAIAALLYLAAFGWGVYVGQRIERAAWKCAEHEIEDCDFDFGEPADEEPTLVASRPEIEACPFCRDCDEELCGCRTCHPR